MRVTCRVTAEGGRPDLHAFRLHLLAPDGAALPAYSTVVLAPGGRADRVALGPEPAAGRHGVRHRRDQRNGRENAA